jgi:hypothetical protein
MDVGFYDVDTVFIHKGCIGTLQCCYPAAARAERDGGVFYPCCAEAVEEIGLACYFAVFEVGVSEFAYVYLFPAISI